MARCRQCHGIIANGDGAIFKIPPPNYDYPFTDGSSLGVVIWPVERFTRRRCSCPSDKRRRSIEEQLEQLVLLRDEDVLTEEEFLDLKSRLTNGGNS